MRSSSCFVVCDGYDDQEEIEVVSFLNFDLVVFVNRFVGNATFARNRS